MGSCDQATEADFSFARTRAKATDLLEGLTGHQYIKARNLNKPVQRVQTSAHQVTLQPEGK